MIKGGSVCELICGRRKGERVTVKKVIEPYVLATDSKGKERKYAIRHLKLVE
ncbi:MAG: hypothetical protein QW590_01580 [Candidatus Bilamarchaeaceae archaeon]